MTWKSAYAKIIRAKGYRVRFVHLETAFADYLDGEIRIDLHNNIAPVKKYAHELIHHCYPKMPHSEVVRLEAEIWENATQKQKLKLYKKLFQ